jgi:DNA-binding LacI/PurR family transcriptional regulator
MNRAKNRIADMHKNTDFKPLSRVDQVSSQLVKFIKEERKLRGQQLPSTAELAKRFGISYVTASKSLQKLQDDGWVKRINGIGTFVERDVATNGINKIYVPLRVDYNPFFVSCYEEISSTCSQLGIEVILGSGNEEDKFIDRMVSETDNPAVLRFPTGPSNEYELQKKLYSAGARTVILNDWWLRGGIFPCVLTDEESALWTLLDHLYKCGHRRIVLLDDAHYCQRLSAHDAFIRWHWMHGDHVDQEQFLYLEQKDVYDRLIKLIENGVTALITLFDLVAIQTLSRLENAGIKVPEQLSIVSFDGTQQAEKYKLTFMRQDVKKLVSKALETLMSDNYKQDGVIKIQSELVLGESVIDISRGRK